MALRAYIQSIEFPTDAEAHIVAVVTDDVRKQEVFINATSLSGLKDDLKRVLQRVDNVTDLKTIKANDVIDLTEQVQVQPGSEFFTAWSVLTSELAKVEAGLLAADDPRVTDARATALSLDTAGWLVGRR